MRKKRRVRIFKAIVEAYVPSFALAATYMVGTEPPRPYLIVHLENPANISNECSSRRI